jgi:hypothetical protein
MRAFHFLLCSIIFLASLDIFLAKDVFAQTGLKSGVYEGLILAVDPSRKVTGYYREDQGDGVTKSCSFFLSGQEQTGQAHVVTWSLDSFLPGSIKTVDQGIILRIKSGRDRSGCASVLPPLISEGMPLDRVAAADWTSLRRVITTRSYFFKTPRAGTAGGAYVVLGDVVGVLSRTGAWLKAEYPRDQRVTGWLRAADTAEVRPPRH